MYDWRSKPKTFAHVKLMSCMAMKVEDIYQTLLPHFFVHCFD